MGAFGNGGGGQAGLVDGFGGMSVGQQQQPPPPPQQQHQTPFGGDDDLLG